METVAKPSTLRSILQQRCSRCRIGAIFQYSIFRGFPKMCERCSVCDLKFEREPGYFLGALYVSYLASIPPVLLLMLLFWRVFGWRFDLAVIAAFVAYLPVVPVVTRAARVVWMHLDRHFDP